jgi:hypothetical protein
MGASDEQRRILRDIEERIETIRRQAEAIRGEPTVLEAWSGLQPRLEGTLSNVAHIREDLALLEATLEQ